MIKVLVIGGGYSAEREVSLRSSRAVFEALPSGKYQKDLYDWDGSELWLKNNLQYFDAVLPILHGIGGEDGEIQQILEQSNTKFLGSGSAVSAICFDKNQTQAILSENGILVPKNALISQSEYASHELSAKPHVLKPFNDGSSIDTILAKDGARIDETTLQDIFSRHEKMLLEEYISGDEITIPILEDKDLSVIEIIPPKNQFFSYENKYNDETIENCPPKHLLPELQTKAKIIAKKVHDTLGCRHLSRTDMIVRGEDMYTLEINTMPGLTAASLFPKAAKAASMDFSVFTDYLVELALNS